MIKNIDISLRADAVCDRCQKQVSLDEGGEFYDENIELSDDQKTFEVLEYIIDYMQEIHGWGYDPYYKEEGFLCLSKPRFVCRECLIDSEKHKDDSRIEWSDGNPLFPEDPPKIV